MSSGGRTRVDDTSRTFRTYAATLDGSWPTETRWFVTCQSGFLGSTGMSKHDLGLLQTLRILRQMVWPRTSQSLLYMSSAISRGVIRFRITSRGLILGGTCDGLLEYHILLWTSLRSFLTTQLMPLLFLSLFTRRFLLSSSGPDILPTHTRSSATSELEWGQDSSWISSKKVILWLNAWLNECMNDWWKMYAIYWINVWMNEGMKILEKMEVLPVLASCTD